MRLKSKHIHKYVSLRDLCYAKKLVIMSYIKNIRFDYTRVNRWEYLSECLFTCMRKNHGDCAFGLVTYECRENCSMPWFSTFLFLTYFV